MARNVSVRGIALHQDKLLCVRLQPYKNHLRRDNSYWCLPGGGLDENESLVAGITREMIEETGVEPVIGNLLYIQQFVLNGEEHLEFFFHITNAADYTHINLAQTTHGQAEIAEIGFVDPHTVRILPDFLATEPLEKVAASGGPARIISKL